MFQGNEPLNTNVVPKLEIIDATGSHGHRVLAVFYGGTPQ